MQIHSGILHGLWPVIAFLTLTVSAASSTAPQETTRQRTAKWGNGKTEKVWNEVLVGKKWLKDGEMRRYHRNGELAESGTYIIFGGRSMRHGTWLSYLESGVLEYEKYFRWDRKQGPQVSFHYASGRHEPPRRRTVTEFVDGLEHGPFVEYCPDGETVRRQGRYHFGERAGTWKTWKCESDRQGELRDTKEYGIPEPPPIPKGDKPIELSSRTKTEFKKFTELVEAIEVSEQVAEVLTALAPLRGLLDGVNIVDAFEISSEPWDLMDQAAAGLAAGHRADLRFFARAEMLRQRKSRADYLFWKRIADSIRRDDEDR